MTKYATMNPLGSTSPYDFFDNAQNFDTAINSITTAIWQDRFGKSRHTWFGLEAMAKAAISAFGYITMDSFQAGATLTLPNQVLRDTSTGEYYRWDGIFPPGGKVVQAGSTPASSGGVGIGAWLSVGDATLRQNLKSSASGLGDSLVTVSLPGSSIPRTVDDKMLEISSSADYLSADGSDEMAALSTAVTESEGKLSLVPQSVKLSGPVGAGGKKIEPQPGFVAYQTDPSLAHAQVLPGQIITDSYTKYDACLFGLIGPTVLCYGDSNTAWVNESGRIGMGQGSWPAYLDAFLGEYVYYSNGRVRGDGAPGKTSTYALNNFDINISAYNPQIVILGWGTNDIAGGFSRQQYINNMSLLIEKFQRAGALVIVLGIPWHHVNYEKSLAWNSSLAELSRNYGVSFIPLYTIFANASASYFGSDGVHYTDLANQMIAKIVGEEIVSTYGLPRNKMSLNRVKTHLVSSNFWECEGVRSTYGSDLQVVQTPDPYVRRLYPYSLKIDAGKQVSFKAAGPFAAVFNWPDSSGATWTLNGSAYSPITRGAVIRVNSTTPRLDGSESNFRVGCTSGSIYLVAVMSEFGYPPRIYSASEIVNGLYPVSTPITVREGNKSLQTIMIPASSGVDTGYCVDMDLANVGPLALRPASAPLGFKFFNSEASIWYKYDGSAWVSYG